MSIPGCNCVPFSYLGTRRVFIEIIGSSRKAFKVLERCVLVFGTIWEEGVGSKMQLLTEYWWIYIIYDLFRVEQSTAGQEFWQVQTHIYIIFTENKGFRRGFYHISIGLELRFMGHWPGQYVFGGPIAMLVDWRILCWNHRRVWVCCWSIGPNWRPSSVHAIPDQ